MVAYVGDYGGLVPYTAYNARKSYIEKHPDIIEQFTKAINKGLAYVDTHTAKEIAESIIDFFPDTSLTDMETIIARYKTGDAWKKNITITEDEWLHMQEIIEASGELDKYVPYDTLIYQEFFDNND